MLLEDITAVILTRDEEANVGRTLASLSWLPDVVVVDSFSSDRTVPIARSFPNVRLVQREFDTLAEQSTYGLAQARTPWVLLLDADYVVPAELEDELRSLEPAREVKAFTAAFTYAVHGRPLSASLYPPRVVLLHRDHATVWQDGHAHRVRVDGATGTLRAKITHDDRKSFRRFVERQCRYMEQEAAKLRTADPRTLNLAARVRTMTVVAPVAVVLHSLFVRGLIRDGWPGVVYTFERFTAELILSWKLLVARR